MFDLFSGALALSTTVAADKEARYSRAGERPTGSGVIRITVYGSTMKEVMTRFEKMKNEKHITADEPLVEQIGKRWCCTWKEVNCPLADIISFPRDTRGKENHSARCTEEDVRRILKMSAGDMHPKDIAKKMHMPLSRVQAIVYRRTWLHVKLND